MSARKTLGVMQGHEGPHGDVGKEDGCWLGVDECTEENDKEEEMKKRMRDMKK